MAIIGGLDSIIYLVLADEVTVISLGPTVKDLKATRNAVALELPVLEVLQSMFEYLTGPTQLIWLSCVMKVVPILLFLCSSIRDLNSSVFGCCDG